MEKKSGESDHSDIFIKAGGQFPFRRYTQGMAGTIGKLRYLINEYSPLYNPDGFDKSKIESKVKSIMFPEDGTVFDYFEKGPKNVSQESDWGYNEVIDFYTETARMSSPGYGKSYTPLDLWFDKSLSETLNFRIKGRRTLVDVREGIHKDGEVRLAYVTDSIGLYHYIKEDLLGSSASSGGPAGSGPTVVDISAFGDRLVAAAATGYNYIGVDPDPNLVEGISRLSSDIKTIKPDFNYNMYTLPFEHFTPCQEVDLITLSPPPFLAEPYTGGDRQVHKVYPDFKNWFYGFVRDTLTRSFAFLKENGVLAFTILDRPGGRSKSGDLDSSLYQIYYTEAMILYAMYLGFRPVEIFTLSSDSGTPWWIFRKDSSYMGTNKLFLKYYPDYIISDYFTSKSPSIEFIRYLAFGYISEICLEANIFRGVDPGSQDAAGTASKILSRILMSKVPSELDSDPVYPDNYSNVIILDDDLNPVSEINFPITIQTSDPGYKMSLIDKSKYTDPKEVLLDIFHMVTYYLQWIQCTTEFQLFAKSLRILEKNGYVNLGIDKRYELSSIAFLRKRTLFSYDSLEKIRVLPHITVLWSSKDRGITKNNMGTYLRYATVGAPMHHFTRPMSRIDALAKIAKLKSRDQIVDLFANMSNANSKLYTSVYPDVDVGSLGNFFGVTLSNHHVFMANPPPYNGFNEKMIDRLVNVYLLGDPKNVVFYSTTVYEADAMDYLNKIRAGEDPGFNNFEGYYALSYLWTYYKNYIKAVYILDHDLHPSLDPTTDKTYGKRRPTESVGVILAGDSAELDLSYLRDLSNGADVQL